MTDYALRLESIGDDARDKLWHWGKGRVRMGRTEVAVAKSLRGRKPFVKEVIRVDLNGTLTKRAIEGHKSYLEARSAGGRGVYYHYTLQQGCCYQIQQQVSWKKARRYFAIVMDRALIEIDELTVRHYARHRTAADA